MDIELANNYVRRLENVKQCVRNQNSGADIHLIGNIRNIATGLIELLEEDPSCLDEKLVAQMIKNVEDMVVDFYKHRFKPGRPKRDC